MLKNRGSIIGRERECKELEGIIRSKKAEFVAVYGRRRVGKTHLIREFFKPRSDIFFYVTGLQKAKQAVQINAFLEALEVCFGSNAVDKNCKTWSNAFALLYKAIVQAVSKKKIKTITIFLDELPWLASRKSNLVMTLDHYWNQYFSSMPNIRLIICGSAASWMIEEILNDTGGLHNRVTLPIRLMPFSLKETQLFLSQGGIREGALQYNRQQILEIYMAIGGIPAYLVHLKPHLSPKQNIDQLCFGQQAILKDEFSRLYQSLFENADAHYKIVLALSKKRVGLSRDEISLETRLQSGGVLTKYLKELEEAGFIEGFVPYGKVKNVKFYRLIDEFSWFYLTWMQRSSQRTLAGRSANEWQKLSRSPAYFSWSGYAFENLCLKHFEQICRALKLDNVLLKQVGPWRTPNKKATSLKEVDKTGVQIDLVAERDDGVVNLFEMKFSQEPFVLSTAVAKEFLRKIDVFREFLRPHKQVSFILVSPFGVKNGPWNDEVLSGGFVTLEEIFN